MACLRRSILARRKERLRRDNGGGGGSGGVSVNAARRVTVLVAPPKTGSSFAHAILTRAALALAGRKLPARLEKVDPHKIRTALPFIHPAMLIKTTFSAEDGWRLALKDTVKSLSPSNLVAVYLVRDYREAVMSNYDYMSGDFNFVNYTYNRQLFWSYAMTNVVAVLTLSRNANGFALLYNDELRNASTAPAALTDALRFFTGVAADAEATANAVADAMRAVSDEDMARLAKVPVDRHKTWQEVLTAEQQTEVACMWDWLVAPFLPRTRIGVDIERDCDRLDESVYATLADIVIELAKRYPSDVARLPYLPATLRDREDTSKLDIGPL